MPSSVCLVCARTSPFTSGAAPSPIDPATYTNPPALTAGLNGRFGLPPVVMICREDDCAARATAVSTIASGAAPRMSDLLQWRLRRAAELLDAQRCFGRE